MTHATERLSAADLKARLQAIPSSIRAAISPAVEREATLGGAFRDPGTSVIYVGYGPAFGIGPYRIVVGPQSDLTSLRRYEAHAGLTIPDLAYELLCSFNGAVFYEMGIHSACIQDLEHLSPFNPNRSPFSDFAFSFSVCSNGFRGINGHPEIALRRSTLDHWIRFFQSESGTIAAFNTEANLVDRFWPDASAWLRSEISAAQKFHETWREAWQSSSLTVVQERGKNEA
ncbi:hypothetical protein [Aquabacterium sp.]|uniref:hypothetical protein n=1 Tax=Aquabacterium sp. TaxID=1872578 RepID=UPI003784DFD5